MARKTPGDVHQQQHRFNVASLHCHAEFPDLHVRSFNSIGCCCKGTDGYVRAKHFVDTTHTDHGLVPSQQPRTFNSFADAAAEAAISRLYGGIHFGFDNNNGLACGECIGQKIHDRVTFREE